MMTEEGLMQKEAIFASVHSVRTDMCEFIFHCVILDLAQPELARESLQTLEYLLCY